MKNKISIICTCLAGVFLLALGVFYVGQSHPSGALYLDAAQIAQGQKIYAQFCAACHGQQLEGQANWRTPLPNGRFPAPPHDPSGHTWHHPDADLMRIIRDGLIPGVNAPEGHESDMPAYGGQLSDTQIEAVLVYIKSTWPPEIQAQQRQISQATH